MKTRVSLVLGLVLVLSATACGQGDTDTAQDPAATSSPTASATAPTPGEGEVAFTEVGVFTGSDEGGQTATSATPLDSRKAVSDFVGQFKGTMLADEIRQSVAGVSGATPYAQVVAIGCEVPASISVMQAPDGYAINAVVPKTNKQCLVAMTSVAIVTVP